jgi:lysophospholipase L1-like esterase/pimeloyl-ACP methyl ester carboxylesterase
LSQKTETLHQTPLDHASNPAHAYVFERQIDLRQIDLPFFPCYSDELALHSGTEIIMQISLFPTLSSLALTLCLTSLSDTAAQDLTSPQDVVFRSRLDQTEQRYVVLLPPEFQANVPHDLVIALHGHGSDRWQFVNDERGECRGTRDAATERNAIFVSPDYRAKTSWMGPAATADLRQILDDLHGQYRIRNVIISGGSMGGTSAMAFAAMHPECVDGVVSLNGTANLIEYPNFSDAIAESYGGSRIEKPDVYQQRSAEFFAERLTMPFAATTGGKDTLVPPDSVLRLMDALQKQGSPALLTHRPDGGHDTNYDDTIAAFRFVFDQLAAKSAASAPVLSSFDKENTIVCLGDSVTGVYYHTGGHRAYPEMLELALQATQPNAPIKVINAGISGNTTVNGLERLETDVLPHHPAIVTISFGLNDMVRVPPEQFRSNLEQLVDRCRAQQSQVVLCTPNAVIDTSDRPITKLVEYSGIIREVAAKKMVRVCDQYQAGERLKQRAPWTWRLTLSDAIHPNMDGHRRMAEELCRCITGQEISLDAVQPPESILERTQQRIDSGMPVRILSMAPVAAAAEAAIRAINADAKIEMTTWEIDGKSLAELEQEAKAKVRAMMPDLVVLAIPPEAPAESDEQFVHAVSWIMNWSLSFGQQEWDVITVDPAALNPSANSERTTLLRKLVHAQHIRGQALQTSIESLLSGQR